MPNALKDFYSVVNDSIFEGKWNVNLAHSLSKPLSDWQLSFYSKGLR